MTHAFLVLALHGTGPQHRGLARYGYAWQAHDLPRPIQSGPVWWPWAEGIEVAARGWNPSSPFPFSCARRNSPWSLHLLPSPPSLHQSNTLVRLAGATPLHSTTSPTPTPMDLKVGEEDPKPPVNDLGGSVLQGGRSGGGFGPRWGSGVVVVHLRWQDLAVAVQCSRRHSTVVVAWW
jgi:hypothetical protein